jgi:hypothetical protein
MIYSSYAKAIRNINGSQRRTVPLACKVGGEAGQSPGPPLAADNRGINRDMLPGHVHGIDHIVEFGKEENGPRVLMHGNGMNQVQSKPL